MWLPQPIVYTYNILLLYIPITVLGGQVARKNDSDWRSNHIPTGVVRLAVKRSTDWATSADEEPVSNVEEACPQKCSQIIQ